MRGKKEFIKILLKDGDSKKFSNKRSLEDTKLALAVNGYLSYTENGEFKKIYNRQIKAIIEE